MIWYCTNCGTENDVDKTVIGGSPFSKHCKCGNCPAEILITYFNNITRLPIKPDRYAMKLMKSDKEDVVFDLNTISRNKYYVKDRYYVFVEENADVRIGRIEDSEYIKNNFKFGYKKL